MKQRAYVTEVVDGDSFKTKSDRMRLEGVDAPEINSDNGRKVKRKLEDLILGKYIDYEGQARDDYARLVVQVWVDGMNVNNEMNEYIENL